MSQRSEADVLCDVIDHTRELTLYYLTKLKGVDIYKTFTAGSQSFNSAFWIICHMAWAQDFLLLKATGGPDLKIQWLSKFGIGTHLPPREECPSVAEVMDALQKIHIEAVGHLRTLTNEQLNEPNLVDLKFGAETSKRVCIQHCIRHEGVHMGQLSWLIKMHGVK